MNKGDVMCHYCNAEFKQTKCRYSKTDRYYDFCDEKCFKTWARDDKLPKIRKNISKFEEHLEELKPMKELLAEHPFISQSNRLTIADLVFHKACLSRKNVQKAKNLLIKERHNMFNFCDENREQEWMNDSTLMTYSDLLTEKSLSELNLTANIFT